MPVKDFWSISLYNAKGYFQENDLKAYSLNDLTAKSNSEGSYTIRFGGCGEGVDNCLPIMEGWNYAVRMYEPSSAIQDGTWSFQDRRLPETSDGSMLRAHMSGNGHLRTLEHVSASQQANAEPYFSAALQFGVKRQDFSLGRMPSS